MRADDLKYSELLSIDKKYGFPMLGPNRMMLMGAEQIINIGRDLVKIIGHERMATILTRIGFSKGFGIAMAISELYDFESPEEWLKAGTRILAMSGSASGTLDEVVIDREKKIFRNKGKWRESIEATAWLQDENNTRESPVCFILTGLASGYASAVLGSEVLVKEVTCMAQGHKHCTFEGRSASEWGLTVEEVREYFDLQPFEEEMETLKERLNESKKTLNKREIELEQLKNLSIYSSSDSEIIFRSNSMAQTLMLAEKVAPTNSTVLIQGESGTGKEVMARFIHRHSDRKDKLFLGISCAALPPDLLESELFGHVKGAFTGADSNKTGLLQEAKDGTFFLDEVGELPLALQAKLLRVLQEKEIRPVGGNKNIKIETRIVAATNRDLKKMVQEGTYREDLYYRLAVFPLKVLPLRERKQDILILARFFLSRLNPRHPGLAPATIRQMENYRWPGNVRELENCIEYSHILAGNQHIMPDHLPPEVLSGNEADLITTVASDFPTYKELEKRYTNHILEYTKDNKSEAAKILGTSVTTLWRRLKD
ncbi:MAG: sigma-54-dependent Fis family transcriptional regulator [Desulfobacterales bacterium]|nr:sigma-54-dependent Fis family transcriptional regulator [Desulfobacterales bacterium]MCP4158575.1 sigma-54-dependent Fis family transcriptional regulator [Deltaproteobacteria bacterium]